MATSKSLEMRLYSLYKSLQHHSKEIIGIRVNNLMISKNGSQLALQLKKAIPVIAQPTDKVTVRDQNHDSGRKDVIIGAAEVETVTSFGKKLDKFNQKVLDKLSEHGFEIEDVTIAEPGEKIEFEVGFAIKRQSGLKCSSFWIGTKKAKREHRKNQLIDRAKKMDSKELSDVFELAEKGKKTKVLEKTVKAQRKVIEQMKKRAISVSM